MYEAKNYGYGHGTWDMGSRARDLTTATGSLAGGSLRKEG